jgi:hypothetical protein
MSKGKNNVKPSIACKKGCPRYIAECCTGLDTVYWTLEVLLIFMGSFSVGLSYITRPRLGQSFSKMSGSEDELIPAMRRPVSFPGPGDVVDFPLPYRELIPNAEVTRQEIDEGNAESAVQCKIWRLSLPADQPGRTKLDPVSGLAAMPSEGGTVTIVDLDQDGLPDRQLRDDNGVSDDGGESGVLGKAEADGQVFRVEELNHPRGVAWLDPKPSDGSFRLAIAENGGHSVSIHEIAADFSGSRKVASFGGPGNSNAADMFYYPQDLERIEIAGLGEMLAVADGPNDRVKIISPVDGKMETSCATRWPWGIGTVSSSSSGEGEGALVYAVVGKEIVKFDAETGKLIETVANDCGPSVCTVDSAGNLLYVANNGDSDSNGALTVLTPAGRVGGRYPLPKEFLKDIVGLTLDETRGRIVMTNSDGSDGARHWVLQTSMMVKAARKT